MSHLHLLTGALLSLLAGFLTGGCGQQNPSANRPIKAFYLSGIHAESARFLAADFAKQTGIEVTIVNAPFPNLHEKAVTDLVAKTGIYDVIQVASQWEGELLPHLRPLDQFIASDDPGLQDYLPTIMSNTATWQGRIHALPMANEVLMLFYRTDVFAARTQEYEQKTGRHLEPPQSWPEYLAMAKFLNDETIYGNIPMGPQHQSLNVWLGILWSSGGALLTEQGHPAFNSDSGVQSLRLLMEMFKYAPPRSVVTNLAQASHLFLQGKGAMYLAWPSLICADLNNPVKSKIAGKVAAANIPGGVPPLHLWSLGIAPSSPRPEAAYQWIKFYCSAYNSRQRLLQFGQSSVRSSTFQDVQCQQSVFYLPQLHEAIKRGRIGLRVPSSQELYDCLESHLAEAIMGTMNPKTALDNAATQWHKILKKSGRLNGGA
jgi:ABC-type glycerol-3-phosphate transport system substrate-binding protein